MRRIGLLFPLVAMVAPAAFAGGVAADIGISGFTYVPGEVTVEAGETVGFTASTFHPLAFDDNAGLGCDQDCNIVFRTPGEYGFFCENHGSPGAGMSGTITVVASTITDRLFLDPFERSYD